MCRFIVLLGFLVFGTAGFSQYPGYTSVKDISAFREKFTAASAKMESIQSDFVQEKNLSLLAEKIVSRGKFWFKKDDRVRMEYQQPFQYLMVINKGEVLVRDGQKENRMSARSNKLLQQINRITIDCVQGTVFSNPDFKTIVFENKSSWLLEMTPVAKNLRDYFKTIVVVVDKTDDSVSSIDMNEASGDHTKIRFVNKELNAKIADHLFAVR